MVHEIVDGGGGIGKHATGLRHDGDDGSFRVDDTLLLETEHGGGGQLLGHRPPNERGAVVDGVTVPVDTGRCCREHPVGIDDLRGHAGCADLRRPVDDGFLQLRRRRRFCGGNTAHRYRSERNA